MKLFCIKKCDNNRGQNKKFWEKTKVCHCHDEQFSLSIFNWNLNENKKFVWNWTFFLNISIWIVGDRKNKKKRENFIQLLPICYHFFQIKFIFIEFRFVLNYFLRFLLIYALINSFFSIHLHSPFVVCIFILFFSFSRFVQVE